LPTPRITATRSGHIHLGQADAALKAAARAVELCLRLAAQRSYGAESLAWLIWPWPACLRRLDGAADIWHPCSRFRLACG
jgi:hypothetical protein